MTTADYIVIGVLILLILFAVAFVPAPRLCHVEGRQGIEGKEGIIFFGSPVIASASVSRCCGSASPASRYVHGTLF